MPTFNPVTNGYRLCLTEQYIISFKPDQSTLNSRSEFSPCRHKDPNYWWLLTRPNANHLLSHDILTCNTLFSFNLSEDWRRPQNVWKVYEILGTHEIYKRIVPQEVKANVLPDKALFLGKIKYIQTTLMKGKNIED